MILVTTSVWAEHLRAKDKSLTRLLELGNVVIHPMIMGELACGNLINRKALLELWLQLPQANHANHDEALFYLHNHQLMGKGIGRVDVHL